jgi:hypothetical protein
MIEGSSFSGLSTASISAHIRSAYGRIKSLATFIGAHLSSTAAVE